MANIYLTVALSFVLVLFSGPIAIPILRRLKVGQTIRSQGPARHQIKAGTPTMGGLLFVAATTITAIVFGQRSTELWLLLGLFIAFAGIGFADDYLKVVKRQSLGLKARSKLLLQVASGIAFYSVIVSEGIGTWLRVPVVNWTIDLGPWYAPFVILVIIGTANAVNLTDGLDGLAAGSSVIVLSFFLLVALMQGTTDLAIFAGALGAALAGFLFFNAHPAQVIMGDIGSLSIGAAMSGLAVLTKTELLLPIAGGLFVIEALSVMVQVGYFRITGGRRLLRMSPLHHHFELSGWSEQRVVSAFWALSVLFAALALMVLLGWGG